LFTIGFHTLPLSTWKLFESTISSNTIYPSVYNLLQFVRGLITVLENVGELQKSSAKSKSSSVIGPYGSRRTGKSNPVALIAAKSTDNRVPPSTVTCPCSRPHTISGCSKFRSWSLDDRNCLVYDNKVCFNCFSSNNWIRTYPSKSRCQKCSKKHHSLLHGAIPPHQEESSEDSGEGPSCCATELAPRPNAIPTVLLGTALVHVRDRFGSWQTVRTLVDSASQISAITVACSDRVRGPCQLMASPVHLSSMWKESSNAISGRVRFNTQNLRLNPRWLCKRGYCL
jgi:hypothetical protein